MANTLDPLRTEMRRNHRLEEAAAVERLRRRHALSPDAEMRIADRALRLAAQVRAAPRDPWSAETFLRHHGLSTAEGVSLMCLAEALLRIPDPDTADALLREKLAGGRWPQSEDATLMANAADWALMLTGTLARWHDEAPDDLAARLRRVVARLGEPLARAAVRHAMRMLAEQFVLAQTIEGAAARAAARAPARFSYDMLGEAARTAEDAEHYFESYAHAIRSVPGRDGVSVKLSALHPRFEEMKRARMFAELLPRLRALALLARERDIALTLDAEESERLELSLDLFEALARDSDLGAWSGLGLAVQAYQKRAPDVCEWTIALARAVHRRFMVRLVKGAYWDGEIKRAQQLGMPGYPVYTRKAATDLSYNVCAALLLAAPEAVLPAFATHNCRTVAAVLELAGGAEFEFQRLHGMGEALYAALAGECAAPCRIYAPVGSFNELLPYLVRRLLENGANTSFVHQLADPSVPIEALVADPLATLPEPYAPDARIPLPAALYGDRRNSLGADLCRRDVLEALAARVCADRGSDRGIPHVDLDAAIAAAARAADGWSRRPADERAGVLERAADAFEERRAEFISLLVREGGKTCADADAELRETADFCRYYAMQARAKFGAPQKLRGATGESNALALHGRGVFACISPWNFPLAIFTGQVAAALAAGNSVIAKPAEQTPITAARAVELLHASGVPRDALSGAYGEGGTVGARLVSDPRIAGVAFTGSVETARSIHLALAQRPGPIVPLIAETGGLNAMLVDASALPEQVVDDVIASAFQSAGQRCSALRLLFVDESCAARVLRLLAGAMRELKVGDPAQIDTDVGPIIDAPAREALVAHAGRLRRTAQLIAETRLPAGLPGDRYFAPVAFRLALDALPRREVFGPVLHVCAYRQAGLDTVLAAIRATGYGLTLGVHSRVQGFIERVIAGAPAGNIYVNRNMIGAVVGVQPFGGEGLSGTGFKAGGPNYLLRFALERTITENTTVIGGNAELLAPGGNS